MNRHQDTPRPYRVSAPGDQVLGYFRTRSAARDYIHTVRWQSMPETLTIEHDADDDWNWIIIETIHPRCRCGGSLSAHEQTTGAGDCFGCRSIARALDRIKREAVTR